MEPVKTIGIIGAGVSGIITAKTCLEYGYEVKVFEKDAELGGVWATSRRYVGVRTQNTKDTYFFSDFPMPKHYPQWPNGEQVQAYLKSFAEKFNVLSKIHFSSEVVKAEFDQNKWTLRINENGSLLDEQVDFLIVCNGTFSDPYIPAIPGMDSFVDAGGEILHSTGFKSPELSRDKRMIVVGYSKSAHDVATEGAKTAKSARLVFREAKWKIPPFVKGLNMKYALLNRLGEALIKPDDTRNSMERFVHKIGLAKKMLAFMQNEIKRVQHLEELGLVPNCGIPEQAFGEITLETQGFFQMAHEGKIQVTQGEIKSLNGKTATLSNGEQVECDLLVFATGFRQTIPFFSEEYMNKLLDENGNYVLYHHILPAGIPSMAFVGYNTSIQSTISSEFGALWVCEYLKGRVHQPSDAEIIQEGTDFIKWRSRFRQNASTSGLSTMPGTIHHVDMLLRDMKAPLPFFSLIPDWLVTINPGRYKQVRKKIIKANKLSGTV
jgi:cation diffusion facilitator CzcD-associated flavoprotein CzcO